MDDDRFGRVEDYTDAFLCIAWLLLVSTLVTIWGVWGYPAALALGAALHWVIRVLGIRRARAEAEWDARVEAALERARR
ncbi:MAG: hypothetical protein WBA25_08190 [Jannaschia sp.]